MRDLRPTFRHLMEITEDKNIKLQRISPEMNGHCVILVENENHLQIRSVTYEGIISNDIKLNRLKTGQSNHKYNY